MPHHTSLIAILCVGFVLAFVLGMAARRLRLSPLVGYLIAGIVAGPFTPGFVGDQSLAPQLAEIGVILLMFGVGLHFSLKDLMAVKAIAIPGAIVQIAVATLLGWGLSALLGWPTLHGVIFGFSLATASTVVLLRAMEERRLLETQRGRIAVGWLIVEDLACVLALVLMPVIASVLGAKGEEAITFGDIVVKILTTLVQVGLFVGVMLVVGRRVIPWLLENTAGTGSRELFTLAVLSIALGIAVGSAELFGVSFALGAFFAGMLLNESELSHKAAQDSLPMRDAFAVLFFVSVGMLFDPHSLLEQPLLILATAFIILFGKSAAAYLIVRAFGHPNRTALTISASLAQIGEFAFIIAGLGVTLDIMPKQAQDLVLAGALISIMLNPVVFRVVDRWLAREDAHEQAQQARDADKVLADDAAAHHVPDDVTDHAIVVGFGRVGGQLAGLLRARGVPVVVVEGDADSVARARADGFPSVRGNIAAERVMQEAAPERAKMAVFAIPHALEAGEAIARLKALNPGITVLARAHSDTEVKHLLEHGADGAVLAERELAYSLAEMVMATPPYRPARTTA
ncbi:YbaL family putative K(+) efflux transporter [Luteimonas lutimaris]|uniref:YbaL family putative K(+) efflux transporter n=1 Tax=Luteimonas lutimaris TaxID=698645 RepID=A0ABP7M7F2_9GAMM